MKNKEKKLGATKDLKGNVIPEITKIFSEAKIIFIQKRELISSKQKERGIE